MTVISRMMRQDFDRRIANVGVTRSQWSMIVAVARHPGSTQRQVSELLEMSEASAGRLIDRLCADGLLERQERNDDRRARSVFVTDKAKPILEQLGEIARASEGRVFQGLSEDDLGQLSRLLDKVYRNLA